jgi:hypothetical protein
LPDFCTGLRTFEHNNNLSWVPSCANVPQLQALLQVARPAGGAHQTSRPAGAGNGGGNIGGGGNIDGGDAARAGDPPVRSAANPPATHVMVRKSAQKREFTGSVPLSVNVCTLRIFEAISLAGDPPTTNRDGGTTLTCVSWHAKGVCFEEYDRDNAVQTDAEATEFMGWCQVAFT